MAFHHVALATRDLEATHRFYTEAMGFELVKAVVLHGRPQRNPGRVVHGHEAVHRRRSGARRDAAADRGAGTGERAAPEVLRGGEAPGGQGRRACLIARFSAGASGSGCPTWAS